MVESPRWEQLNKCPECGADMQREPQVGEQMGLCYRCELHGRFRYSWDSLLARARTRASAVLTPRTGLRGLLLLSSSSPSLHTVVGP